MSRVKRPTQVHTLPDASAAEEKKRVRLNPGVYHTLSESGGYVCCDCPSRPSRNGRKTRHGSLGRGTLIIRDCPGSMMGNKLSVISHQRTRRRKTSDALALHQSPRGASHPGCRGKCYMTDCTQGSGR